MDWFFLVLAGMFEWGWPVGLKLAVTDQGFRYLPGVAAIICMAASGTFLLLAQRTIPMGTAYAVWTGIGAVGAFVIGILFFKEPAAMLRIASVTLVILGIIGLKFSSGH